MRCFWLVWVSLVCSMTAAATSPEAVVDPRPAAHVVDLAGVLNQDATAAIESSVQHAATAGELFVVIVNSTDGMVARQWTTTLFNRLQLDTRARNRGVVLMAAIKDRKAEIVIGDGYEGSFTATTDNVMSTVVVPRFRSGAPQQAMVDGAAALATAMVASLPSLDGGMAPVDERTAAFDKAVAAARASKQMKAVVDPRPARALLDLAKALNAADVVALNERGLTKIGEDIDVVVVTVKDIGKHAPRAFATAVFEKLALDASPAGRGVLILVLAARNKKERTVEIVHGAGFPAITAAAFAAAANLSAQAKADGIAAATTVAVDVVVEVERLITALNVQRAAEEERRQQERAAAQAQSIAAANTIDDHHDAASGIPLWAGGIGLLGVGLGLREGIRRRPRKCRRCAVNMHRLGEEADDAHLSDGERAEERVGSVDYDIWACGTCGEVLKTRWGAIFTAYSRCRGCSWKTMRTSSHTLQAATEYSTGLAEVTEHCEHCSFHHVSTRTIPRKPKPSPSSSSSSFSSGGGGGGSSSGRGSSGSW